MRGLAVDSLLAEAGARHGEKLVLLCSFQKEESVLLDSIMRVAPKTRVVTIDTGVLFPETLATASVSTSRSRTPAAPGPGRRTAAATPRWPRWSGRWPAPTPG
jgi:3'-phosphoadenosine 5'-phosphosulfate sulfotransferase (PAPS reductase)/FAD synthetase